MKTKKVAIKKKNLQFYAQLVIVFALFGFLMFNLGGSGGTVAPTHTSTVVPSSEIIPTGVPAVYGEELGISYDGVNPSNPQLADQTIAVLSNIDRSETIEGADLERYINILYVMENGISCEYCCGARSIIFEDGSAACGCAHSYAMRGLAKYLVKYQGDQYTDEEILIEVGKWKVLFFPGIHEGKAAVLKAQGVDETDYINLASNKYRGVEQGQASDSGGMVGGC